MTGPAEKTATLAVVPPSTGAIEPTTMGELKDLAADAVKSGYYGAKTPEQALMLLMAGKDLGLSYTQSLRAFHVISVPNMPERISLSSAAQVAVCLRRRDVCEFFRIIESTDKLCTVETKRRDHPARQLTYTIEDAAKAGLAGKKMWLAHPRSMLVARAQAELARTVYQDILLGLYDDDEVREALEREAEGPRRRKDARTITVIAEGTSAAPPEPISVAAEPSTADPEGPHALSVQELREQILTLIPLLHESDKAAKALNEWAGQDRPRLAQLLDRVRQKLEDESPGLGAPVVDPEPTAEQGDAYEGP